MIYSIFFKKTKGDSISFPLTNCINAFIDSNYSQNIFLLIWPGYISKKPKEIDDFKNEIIKNQQSINGYCFKPLNEKYMKSSKQKNTDYLNSLLGNFTCKHKNLDDHSKILAVLEFETNEKDITKEKNITERLKKKEYEVLGIAIGSSNYSYNTFCKSPTPKGEADIFLINGNLYENNDQELFKTLFKESRHNDSIIISKEIVFEEKTADLNKIIEKIIDITLN